MKKYVCAVCGWTSLRDNFGAFTGKVVAQTFYDFRVNPFANSYFVFVSKH